MAITKKVAPKTTAVSENKPTAKKSIATVVKAAAPKAVPAAKPVKAVQKTAPVAKPAQPTVEKKQAAAPKRKAVKSVSYEQIAQAAYLLSLKNHSASPVENWLTAEAQLLRK